MTPKVAGPLAGQLTSPMKEEVKLEERYGEVKEGRKEVEKRGRRWREGRFREEGGRKEEEGERREGGRKEGGEREGGRSEGERKERGRGGKREGGGREGGREGGRGSRYPMTYLIKDGYSYELVSCYLLPGREGHGSTQKPHPSSQTITPTHNTCHLYLQCGHSFLASVHRYSREIGIIKHIHTHTHTHTHTPIHTYTHTHTNTAVT